MPACKDCKYVIQDRLTASGHRLAIASCALGAWDKAPNVSQWYSLATVLSNRRPVAGFGAGCRRFEAWQATNNPLSEVLDQVMAIADHRAPFGTFLLSPIPPGMAWLGDVKARYVDLMLDVAKRCGRSGDLVKRYPQLFKLEGDDGHRDGSRAPDEGGAQDPDHAGGAGGAPAAAGPGG